jgi:hypothetical protein
MQHIPFACATFGALLVEVAKTIVEFAVVVAIAGWAGEDHWALFQTAS